MRPNHDASPSIQKGLQHVLGGYNHVKWLKRMEEQFLNLNNTLTHCCNGEQILRDNNNLMYNNLKGGSNATFLVWTALKQIGGRRRRWPSEEQKAPRCFWKENGRFPQALRRGYLFHASPCWHLLQLQTGSSGWWLHTMTCCCVMCWWLAADVFNVGLLAYTPCVFVCVFLAGGLFTVGDEKLFVFIHFLLCV